MTRASTLAPMKATTGQSVARRINAFLRELGADRGDVSMKSDAEAAINAAVGDVVGWYDLGGAPSTSMDGGVRHGFA